MRVRPLQIQSIARATGCVVVAAAVAATALHFRHDGAGAPAPLPVPSTRSDPLALELARCQLIGMAAKDDATCEAAWAENRRRFFTYGPADSAAPARTGEQNSTAKPEGQ
jgi:conjugative transfer region protein TrbK